MRTRLSVLLVLAVAIAGGLSAATYSEPVTPQPTGVDASAPTHRAVVDVAERAPTRKPIRAIFYYPWFPEVWHDNDHYHPTLGRYSTDDPAILDKHFASMKYAGIDAAISSWWGFGEPTARRLRLVLTAARPHGIKVTPYYERECCDDDPSLSELRRDLRRLKRMAERRARVWLHVDGKPVIFVYNSGRTGCSDVERWRRATDDWSMFYVQMKVFRGFESCAAQPSSWHQYGPAKTRSVHLPWSFNVSPGFYHHEESTPRLERDLGRFRNDLRAMKRSRAPWQLVTSFNEWGEGTSVEPAREWRSRTKHGLYLDAMRGVLKRPKPATRGTGVASRGALERQPGISVRRVGAAADAHVLANLPQRTVGHAARLRVDGSPAVRSYLRFEVVGDPVKAVLEVFSRTKHLGGFSVSRTGSDWQEQDVTFASAPRVGGRLGYSGEIEEGTWVRVDVTRAIDGPGTYSFVLHQDRKRALFLGSRESDRTPRLVLHEKTEDTAVVWAAGDLCDRDDKVPGCERVGRLMKRDRHLDAFLALGDLQYDSGKLSEFMEYYDPKLGSGPGLKSLTYPALGNHEFRTTDAAGYFDYWGSRAGPRGKGYYAVTLGKWRIIVANSSCSDVSCDPGSPQARFIRRQLSRAPQCALVATHHPAISDGSAYEPGTDEGQQIFRLAYAGGAEMMLSGHDHQYQRFSPRNPAHRLDRKRGVVQFVVGTGGKGLTSLSSRDRAAYAQATHFGALRLTLRPGGYDYAFVNIRGVVMDSGSRRCR